MSDSTDQPDTKLSYDQFQVEIKAGGFISIYQAYGVSLEIVAYEAVRIFKERYGREITSLKIEKL